MLMNHHVRKDLQKHWTGGGGGAVYQHTVFPRIISGAIILFFAPKGGDYSRGAIKRGAIISNTASGKFSPKYFILFSH